MAGAVATSDFAHDGDILATAVGMGFGVPR
jgi:hypothetical protein